MKSIAYTEKSHIVAIPTRERMHLIHQNKGIYRYMDELKPEIILFVRDEELEDYTFATFEHEYISVEPVPNYFTIADKRQRVIEYAATHDIEYVFMADDDVTLDHRRTDDRTKFMTGMKDKSKIKDMMETCLRICGSKYPIVHPRIRMHADKAKYRYEKNCPAIRFVCLHVPTIVEEGIRYDGLGQPFMQDRYMQHSLLDRGYRSIALGNFCVGDNGTNTAGGCSVVRTVALHSASAKALADRFKNVDLKKKRDGAWKEVRYDCTQHLKAYLDQGELPYVPKEEIEEGWND